MEDDERKELLWPSWNANANGPKYDALDDVSKAVWRKTRDQRNDADSIIAWLKRLAEAAAQGEISDEDARLAMKRVLDEP